MLSRTEKPRESAMMRVFAPMAVFIFAAAICAYIEVGPRFRDPDSFYHLKMAMLMRDHGIVRAFPWLPFTTLAENYADHHFLYHLLLIPFVAAFGPFVGMTVATVFFAAAAITLFYSLLRVYGIRYAWAYTFVLSTASAFIFRLNLAKTSSLSVSMLFLALIAMRKNMPSALFLLSWSYVLLYGGWPIMAAVVGAFFVSRIVLDRIFDRHPLHSWAGLTFWKRLLGGSRNAWSDFIVSAEARQAGAVLAGLACGIVINPYFPANIRFYWDQIVQIALVGYRDQVGVGTEWYPYNFDRLFADASGVFLLAAVTLSILAFVLFWPETVRRGHGSVRRSEVSPIAASFMLAGAFLAMTLHSRRHVEYFVPFAVFATALLADSLLRRLDPRAALARVASLAPRFRRALPFSMLAMAAVFLYVGMKDVYLVHGQYKEGVAWTKYAGATAWIAAHAPADAIVFHSNWDEFPPLFLHDGGRRYIAGLDPTFLFLQDPVRYRLWADVTIGKVPRGAASLARRIFGAKYVLIENDHEAMRRAFEADPGAASVYKDADAEVFAIL